MWRTLLFVPAGEQRKLATALDSDADAIILDLEDAILEDHKDTARTWLTGLELPDDGPEIVVRINGLDTVHSEADLEAVAGLPQLAAILVPKAIRSSLERLRTDELPPVIALVETAAGVLEAPELARLDRVHALMLGTVDLATELSIDVTPDGPELLQARSSLVLACAAADLPTPIDGVWPNPGDEEGLRREAALARRLGFGAKACIHPRQLAVVAEIFSPSDEQVRWAQAVVAAAAEAGKGVSTMNGEMIDRPVLERAKRVLRHLETTP